MIKLGPGNLYAEDGRLLGTTKGIVLKRKRWWEKLYSGNAHQRRKARRADWRKPVYGYYTRNWNEATQLWEEGDYVRCKSKAEMIRATTVQLPKPVVMHISTTPSKRWKIE